MLKLEIFVRHKRPKLGAFARQAMHPVDRTRTDAVGGMEREGGVGVEWFRGGVGGKMIGRKETSGRNISEKWGSGSRVRELLYYTE